MRKLAILTFVTLDGVMQAPGHPEEDTSGGFSHGGWSAQYWDEVMEQVLREAMAEPYDLLLGRRTYESFAAYWPQADDPVARTLNGATKYVATSASDELEWENSQKLTGDIAVEVAKLKTQGSRLLQVHGSWKLIQTLLPAELIDEFRLWTFPVAVGSGKRLFGEGTVLTDFKLKKTGSTANGVTMSIYSRIAT